MAFCSNCGNEITPGARFCGSCGKEQIVSAAICPKCSKTLEENEKFCSGCGTPVNVAPEVEPKPKEPKLTKESRKIIDAGSKPNQSRNKKTVPPPTAKQSSKPSSSIPQKKKKGCLNRVLKLFGILVLLVVVLLVVVYFLPDPEPKNDGLTDTNIPGIVDIEPGDVSHLPENQIPESKASLTKPIVEERDIKETAKYVEEAFANSDTTQLKLLLTKSALTTYSGVLKEMQPHMTKYAEAYKSRVLTTSTDIYKVYEFKDKEGQIYSAAFELQHDGNWKLTRF